MVCVKIGNFLLNFQNTRSKTTDAPMSLGNCLWHDKPDQDAAELFSDDSVGRFFGKLRAGDAQGTHLTLE